MVLGTASGLPTWILSAPCLYPVRINLANGQAFFLGRHLVAVSHFNLPDFDQPDNFIVPNHFVLLKEVWWFDCNRVNFLHAVRNFFLIASMVIVWA